MNRKTGRNADIDIIKFFSACMIMLCHITLFFNYTDSRDVPFSSAVIFNQLFFIITGFFTAKHFLNIHNIKSIEHPAKLSVVYVIKKLKPTLKFSIVCVVILYLFKIVKYFIENNSIDLHFLISSIEQALYDGLYMRSIGYIETDYGTLWYLSSLLFVLPIVCVLLQSNLLKKYYIYLFSWILPFVYFGYVKFGGMSNPPHRMLYAFSAISIGVFVYVLSERVNNIKVCHFVAVLLTILKWVLFFAFALLCKINIGHSFLYLVVFISISLISLSNLSYHLPSNKFTVFLGNDLSLALYITHFVVYHIVDELFKNFTPYNKIIIAFLCAFVLSICLIFANKFLDFVFKKKTHKYLT